MKILLTGYKGFIGKNMLPVLMKNDHEVLTYEWGECFDWKQLETCDWVIHLGAISSTSETDVNKIYWQNYDFTVKLHEKCIKNNVRMQFASSASVYGPGPNFSENANVYPQTLYALSKVLCEERLKDSAQCFRYFNVFGPGEEHKDQPSPHARFHTQAQQKGYIEIFEGSENMKRDFIHVDVVIDYHLRFLNIKENGIFNIGTGNVTSFREIAEFYFRDVEVREISMPEYMRTTYQYYTCADMSKTNKILGLNVV